MQIKPLGYLMAFVLSVAIARGDTTALTTLAVSAGQRDGLALRSDGSLWAWGTNRVGELGLGTNTLVLSPKRIASLTNLIAISAGTLHSLAVQSNGLVFAWGTNVDGRLGNGTFNSASNPVVVSIITNALTVTAGGNHSLAALADGRVMAWGANNGGQLGTGNTTTTNQPVAAGSFTNAIAVAAGTNFSLALTRSGEVWSWGTNNLGQLGLGSTNTQLSPVKITTLSNIVQIAAGASHGLALDSNGVVYAWGRNVEGQIGNGTTNNSTAPVAVLNLGPTNSLGAVQWIAANFNSSAAVSTAGHLYYWGWYGNGTTNSYVTQPAETGAGIGQTFQTVTYGDSFLLAGQADGSVWAWGYNIYGNWGNGTMYRTNDTWRYDAVNPEFSFSARPTAFVDRFNRGDRYSYDAYCSFILPLDLEQGVRLDAAGNDLYSYGQTTPWFLKVQKTQRQHAWQLPTGTTNLTRFAVDNPIAAYGSEAGGSPLYTGQSYRFGFYSGLYDEKTGQTNMIRILVYDRATLASGATNVAPTNIITIALPRRFIAADSNVWSNFITNGERVVVETNGLRTSVEFVDASTSFNSWGLAWQFAVEPQVFLGCYKLTHQATSTNYYYVVEALGSVEVGVNVMSPMAVTNTSTAAYLPMYALNFEVIPPWRANFIDNPHFEGIPLPPAYAGRRAKELNGLMAVVTNAIWLTNNTAFTNLDSTPELRRHPILDQFVEDMGRNPLALASYVINEVELTDPLGLQETSKQVADSVEVGGVNRSALNVFLEGQGSPTEQCALLVYLLRQAGYSAGYVFPTNGNLRLLDTRLSQLWQMNVHGVVYYSGLPVITNSLIMVNYPWVVANIGTNTVQIFPWLKDTEIVEGQNIYNYLPTNYFSAYDWIKDYALASPSLMALGSPNESVARIWKKYLTNLLNTNQLQANLSLDDFGVRAFNRRDSYPTWSSLPLPNYLTNQSQVAVVPTLSESAVTYPFLTNMFDRVRVEIFKNDTNTANRLFDTGLWRSCDFQNRKLLLYTNAPNNVSLWLASYRSSITNTTNFANIDVGSNSLYFQIVQTNVGATVSNLLIQITLQRRDSTYVSPTGLLPLQEQVSAVYPALACNTRDVTAIIPIIARASPAMLRVYAEDYWNLQRQKTANTNFVPAVTDDAGGSAMMMGLSFFEKMWDEDKFNQSIHKVHNLTWNSFGTASFTRLTNSMVAKLNMQWFYNQLIGNASLRPDSGDRGANTLNNYFAMLQANGSSAEHAVLASLWGSTNSVSSVRLLQLAAQRGRSNGWAMPLELNLNNYKTLGNLSYTGYGATLLKNQDGNLWNIVTNAFSTQWDSNYLRVLITPGAVTNADNTFKGMSSLIFGKYSTGAILSDNQTVLNGGSLLQSFSFDSFVSYTPSYNLSYNLQYTPVYDYSFGSPNFGYSFGGPVYSYSFVHNSLTTPQPRFDFSQYDLATLTAASGAAQIAYTPQQTTQGGVIAGALNLPGSSTANAIKTAKDVGWAGRAGAYIRQKGAIVADPVQVVAGDFYADSVDLSLPGPMPLELRRNYLSRNLADNQLGAGWKLGFTPWLVLTTNAVTNRIIYATEMDGAVIAYRYQSNNLWTVMTDDNPTLVNFTTAGIGSTANRFNNQLVQNATNSALYVLTTSDGGKQTYSVMTNFAIVSGTNQFNRVRPYLTRLEDHAGNYYTCTYGTNSAANDFGQLYRIQSANGATLTFKYDFYARITEVITDDDRHVRYQYDNYGDLVAVTLPDNSGWQYEYQHYTFTTNSQSYTDSYHLLINESKPNGRLLANTYDALRRVVVQAATVGTNRELITNAWFFYTNDCTTLTNDYISGTTRVEDVFHNPYLYYYTNSLITRIEEPLGRTNIQNWFDSTETNKAGYYPRSLEFTIDVRGLTNEFLYTPSGNVTNRIMRGDLTGEGVTGQSATNTYTFTTNNCPATATDPSGNQTAFFYEDATDIYRLTSLIFSSGGTGIATNRFNYTNVTQVMDMGGWLKTNSAFGLCFREIRADAATNEWVFDGRGFPVQSIRYARTADFPSNSDPAVTNYFTYTSRGDLAELADADGRRVRLNHDSVGRIQWRDVLDESGNAISHEAFYYNRNGDLEWYDGPHANPEDYTWFSYDGAGRKVQEIHWRNRAKADGSGVEAETGDNLYATSFSSFDAFGNLTKFTDPRGAVTTNSWDALGRLLQRKSLDTDGATQLAAEGFAYEPGGSVRYYTNALGGLVETRYASTGQPRFRQNADGSTNGWTYYLDGRIRREIQGNGAYAETTYADATLTVTKTFYSATGTPLATNVAVFNPRGNLVQQTDAGGNTFTNTFDGLNRIKIAAGPVVLSVRENCQTPGCGVYVTNTYQQITTYTYTGSGKVSTVANALGENTVTTRDALGRVVSQQTYPSNSITPVRVTTIAYAADHNSFTVTEGSGANAISTTTYTDPDDRALLTIAYPSAITHQINRLQYDLAGNLAANSQLSVTSGALTTWQTTLFAYDGLNRLRTLTERDNAVTTFSYDAAGDETNRALPGNLTWSATYNNAGQILTEKDSNGASNTRNLAYAYYAPGNPWAGLLQTVTDGSGVTRTNSYDDYLRLAEIDTTGTQPEQQMSCVWQYEPRGFLTTIVQSFASTNTGPTTTVQRGFDAYGQLAGDSSAGQSWDAAGRRIQVGGMGFQYRADGRMTAVNGATFGYGDNGLLTGRTNTWRTVTVDQRDGMGRPLQATTRVNLSTVLTENWNWTGDGLPNSYTATRSDYTDTRNFTYGALHRRLTQETLNLGSGSAVTNIYTFDNGVAAGLGVITKVGESQSNSWSGGLDSFARVATETNTMIHRIANGTVNGAATLRGYLNSQPIDVRYGAASASQWTADMNLQRGTNTLIVYADHPSGQFTTNKSATFNVNSTAYDNETSQYDGAGNVTNRVWKDSLGATVKTQTLTWDAFGRLVRVTERDPGNNGFNLVSVFDGLGRQVQTIETAVTNNIALVTNPAPITVNFTYDPQVEFLVIALGISQGVDSRQDSLAYGPDISGGYGGMQGVGGLETITSGTFGQTTVAINDAFGNVIAGVTNGAVGWNAAREGLYAPMEGYAPPRLSLGAPTYASLAWRTRPLNAANYVQLGARPYDFARRAFLSADPLGHSSDPALNTAFGGNPAAYFDADGRAGVSLFQMMFPATAIAAGAKPWTGSVQGDIQYSRGAFAPFYIGAAVMGSPRVQGGFKVVGGSGEMVVGGTGVVATSPTIAGSIVSGAAVVHGADTLQSGWRQMMSGNVTPSYTSRGITALTGSPMAGELGDAGLGVALSLGSGLLTQGPRTGLAGGRVTQFFDPARGLGPEATALTTPPTSGLSRLFDGPWASAPQATTWVAPSAAQKMNWLQRLGTGRPFYNNYVEFDALAGELSNPGGTKLLFASPWQQVMQGDITLAGRNILAGQLAPNYGAIGFLGQTAAQGARVTLSKH